jgi:hypothetical protein
MRETGNTLKRWCETQKGFCHNVLLRPVFLLSIVGSSYFLPGELPFSNQHAIVFEHSCICAGWNMGMRMITVAPHRKLFQTLLTAAGPRIYTFWSISFLKIAK